MPIVYDPATKVSVIDIFEDGANKTNSRYTWNDTETGKSYTLLNGIFRGGTQSEFSDNAKYQVQPNGTVYIYAINYRVQAGADDPNTTINDTANHGALVTYAVDRDAATGAVSIKIINVQDKFTDANGNELPIQSPSSDGTYLERLSTEQGEFLVVKTTGAGAARFDDDADNDQITGIAVYKLGDDGKAVSVDAKVWDNWNNPAETAETDPDLVNTSLDSPYVGGNSGFSLLEAPDGTTVLMQLGNPSNTQGSLIALNSDGTFGPATEFNYLDGTTTEDNAMKALFNNAFNQGGVSATVTDPDTGVARTFVYGVASNTGNQFGRAELTLDANGAPQLSDPTLSTNYQAGPIFAGGNEIEVLPRNTHNIEKLPDIGDGNEYLMIGGSRWQVVKVNPDGTLSAASNLTPNATDDNVDSLAATQTIGPIDQSHLIQYEVDGTTYKGWMVQSAKNGDQGWYFYNPQTGFVNISPTGEEPTNTQNDYFVINGYPTWIGLQNQNEGLSQGVQSWIADGGTVRPLFCFVAGTKILTDAGYKDVTELKIGDLVETLDNGLQPIKWIGSRKISASELQGNAKLRPIHISAGSFGANIPHRDVLLSPQHRVLLRSKLVQRMFGTSEVLTAIKNLLSVPGIMISQADADVEYFHVMLDDHEVLLADGLLAESMLAGDQAMKSLTSEAIEELYTVFPKLRNGEQTYVAAREIILGSKARKLAERSVRNNNSVMTA